MIKAEHAGDTCSAFSDVVNFVVGRTQDFAGSAVVVDVPVLGSITLNILDLVLCGLIFSADIHLYSEHLYRFIAKVRMCDCLHFISVIRNINSATGIVALRISLCDNQAVIFPEHNSLIPVVITQAILFRFLRESWHRSIHF